MKSVKELIKKYKFPVSVAVVRDGKISEQSQVHCRRGERFQAASISKPVAALVVLKLVQMRKLDLNKDVNDYLKGWKVTDKKGAVVKVTLRQLLSHTAGLNTAGFPGYAQGARLPSLRQILDGSEPCNTGRVYVEGVPGKNYSYSGGGYMIIQKILEDVTGMSFDRLAKRYVLDPLGMRHSSFRLRSLKGTKKYPEKAAAGLWTTSEDLAKLLIGIQSGKVVSKSMLIPVAKAEKGFVGFGLFLSKDKKRFSHTGHNHKFTSKIIGSLRGGVGAVYLAHSDERLDVADRTFGNQ